MKRLIILSFLALGISFYPMPTVIGQQAGTPTPKRVIFRFSAPINDLTVNILMNSMDGFRKQGTIDFVILISSPGGTVHAGLTAYNYLKAMPAPVTVTTHNFGSVDSISLVMFCGGSRRLSVPQARFLIHSVKVNVSAPIELEEKQLEEVLKGMRIDTDNIAKVIAANTNKPLAAVREAMFERTTLSPEQAKEWRLIHEIKSELYSADDPVFYIDPTPPKQ